jgi:hypothetical protein
MVSPFFSPGKSIYTMKTTKAKQLTVGKQDHFAWLGLSLVITIGTVVPVLLVGLVPLAKWIPLHDIVLPMYFAPFFAVFFFHFKVAIPTAILSPILIAFVQNDVKPDLILLNTLLLTLFIAITTGLKKIPIINWLSAPIAGFICIAALHIFAVFEEQVLTYNLPPSEHFIESLKNGVLGLSLLFATNVLCIKYKENKDRYAY